MELGKSIALVNAQCPIDQVLDICEVRRQPGPTAWQVQCCFHKGGEETKWSARAYKDTNKMWCYAESKMYFPLDIIKLKLRLDDEGAIAWAMSRFKIDKTLVASEERRRDPVVERLEEQLRKSKRKCDLTKYRQIAYAIMRLRATDITAEKKISGVDVVKKALKELET